MKPILQFSLVCLFALAATFTRAGDAAQVTLDAITRLRADRLAEAKAADKRVDYQALNAEVLAKAKAAIEGVNPANVPLSESAAWSDLFTQAQDHAGARTVAQRWAASGKGEDQFKAQTALIAADFRLHDFTDLAKTLLAAKPASPANGIRLASMANQYIPNIVTNAGPGTALKVLAAGEKALPTDGFADDKQRDLARRTGENLAKTRKLIEENPGKEAEALQKDRRAVLAQLLNRSTGTNAAGTNAAASREARDARLAKLLDTPATDFKATHTVGDFKSLADLKGKVVILDFFAHWCGPCIASFPSVRALQDDLQPKGLRIVGVTRFYGYYKTEARTQRDMPPAKELEHMKEFVTEKNMNWPVAFVDQGVFASYDCTAIPHVVVIDKTGKIRKVKVGYNKDEVASFRAAIEKLGGVEELRVSDLLIGALSALLATNPPAAISNLIHARTGIVVPVTDPNDPVEAEYRQVMEMDDDAESEVDRWIKENHDLAAKGLGLDAPQLQVKIKSRFEPVKKAYETFIAAHPTHARARLAYGGFLSDIGEEEGALQQWDKARELDPANPVPWNNLANFYGHNGPITNAFTCYTKAIELKPGEALYYQNFATTVFLFRKEAMEYFHLTEPQVFEKAMGLYRQARQIDPANFLLATDLAQSFVAIKPPKTGDAAADRKAEQQLADEALAAWRDALKIAPDENARQGVYVHLLRWQINSGRFAEAHASLDLVTNAAFSSTKRALEKKLTKLETATNAPPAAVPPPTR